MSSKRNPGGATPTPKYDRHLLETYPELSAKDYYKPTRRGGAGPFTQEYHDKIHKPKGRAKPKSTAPQGSTAPTGVPKTKPKTHPMDRSHLRKTKPKTKPKPRLWGGRKKLPGDPSYKAMTDVTSAVKNQEPIARKKFPAKRSAPAQQSPPKGIGRAKRGFGRAMNLSGVSRKGK